MRPILLGVVSRKANCSKRFRSQEGLELCSANRLGLKGLAIVAQGNAVGSRRREAEPKPSRRIPEAPMGRARRVGLPRWGVRGRFPRRDSTEPAAVSHGVAVGSYGAALRA